jgi:hypothetical protein
VNVTALVCAALALAGCGGARRAAALLDVCGQRVTRAQVNALLHQGEVAYRAAGKPFPKEGTTTRTIIDGNVLGLLKLHAEERVLARELGISTRLDSNALQAAIENRVASRQRATDAEIRDYYRAHIAQYRAQHLSLAHVRIAIVQYLIGRKRDAEVRRLMASVRRRCG